jgi:hypothetical protein
MCYKPLQTGMERVKILGELRSPGIIFPDDFDQIGMENQVIFTAFIRGVMFIYSNEFRLYHLRKLSS